MPSIRFVTLFLLELCYIYCALSVVYLFSFSLLASILSRNKKKTESLHSGFRRIAILVPAYREDDIILYTAQNLLQLNYPRELFDIYIIADSFRTETLNSLRGMPLCLIEVSFPKSTKTKSLNEAFSRISRNYDIALICDGDNFLEKDFLKKINDSFSQGARAVQARRVPKNQDSPFAILDACSEAINNQIFRKGPNTISLSSSIAGSGMAFEFDLIKGVMAEIDMVGGFDKIVQLKIVQQGIPIHYLSNAMVYDEKVGSAYDFGQQRKRWLSSQFNVLVKYTPPAFRELFRGNINYFNLAFVNNCLLPNSFYLILLPLLILASYFIRPSMELTGLLMLLLYMVALILAIPSSLLNRNLFFALLRLPKAIGLMVEAMFHLKKADERFIHTPHSKKEISFRMMDETGK